METPRNCSPSHLIREQKIISQEGLVDMRDYYNKQLSELEKMMCDMGQMIETAIEDAMTALLEKDQEKAKEIIQNDEKVDHQQKKIEDLCMQLLLSQQPVATDLRQISSAIKMVTDMERIGDHAADISEITLQLTQSGYPHDLTEVKKMAKETTNMLKDSLDAYIEKNAQKAVKVIQQDDVVDDYFSRIKKEIIRQINESSEGGEQEADLLMIIKYLERIGDHATNIAEWVLFYITGEHPDVSQL